MPLHRTILLLVLAACEGASQGELLDASQTTDSGTDDASEGDNDESRSGPRGSR